MGGFQHGVPCTWQLPWLAAEKPWSALAGPLLTLLAQTGSVKFLELEHTFATVSPSRLFLPGRRTWAGCKTSKLALDGIRSCTVYCSKVIVLPNYSRMPSIATGYLKKSGSKMLHRQVCDIM